MNMLDSEIIKIARVRDAIEKAFYSKNNDTKEKVVNRQKMFYWLTKVNNLFPKKIFIKKYTL